jgi:hypothetical protein
MFPLAAVQTSFMILELVLIYLVGATIDAT